MCTMNSWRDAALLSSRLGRLATSIDPAFVVLSSKLDASLTLTVGVAPCKTAAKRVLTSCCTLAVEDPSNEPKSAASFETEVSVFITIMAWPNSKSAKTNKKKRGNTRANSTREVPRRVRIFR